MASFSGRTLVIVLSMHRSGSSLTAHLLQRLGMSLGPFELLGPEQGNPHGHFEPLPVNRLDMDLQQRALGFDGDMPWSEEDLRHFRESDGRWNSDQVISQEDLALGQEQIRQLVASGPVCGLKEPRMLLLWPFWSRVLDGFPGLRVVLLTLVRSPHEVAMSIFMRAKGRYTYYDALNVTAVNLRRLQEIRRTWLGEQVLVRFDPQVYAEDMRLAAKVSGLAWQEAVFQEIFDRSSRHYDPTRVDHEAQRVFDELSGLPRPAQTLAAPMALARDAATREKLIQTDLHAQLQAAQQRNESLEQRLAERIAGLEQLLGPLSMDVGTLAQKCTILSEFSHEQLCEIQMHCQRHQKLIETLEQRQVTIEAMEQRWKKIESHPLYRALRQLRSVSRRIRGGDQQSKAA
jgi:hypothetical protein